MGQKCETFAKNKFHFFHGASHARKMQHFQSFIFFIFFRPWCSQTIRQSFMMKLRKFHREKTKVHDETQKSSPWKKWNSFFSTVTHFGQKKFHREKKEVSPWKKKFHRETQKVSPWNFFGLLWVLVWVFKSSARSGSISWTQKIGPKCATFLQNKFHFFHGASLARKITHLQSFIFFIFSSWELRDPFHV